ncbi:MAG: hypothetical protein ACOCW6_03175 [Spirochaetota bacterium]
MELLVNSQPVELTLEDESTLGEVISGVRNWLAESRLFVTDIQVDEREVPLELPQPWGDQDLEEIGQIRIEAHPQWQVDLALLDTAVEELRDAQTDVNLGSDAQRRLLETVRFLRHLDLGMVEDRLEQHRPLGPEDVAAASTILRSRRQEIADPWREAMATAPLIEEMLPEVEEVAVLLQTGRDSEAMTILIRFVELVSRLLRLFGHLTYSAEHDPGGKISSEGASLQEVTGQLNATLRELVDAFTNQDSVLIGDLLEYEVTSQVRELLSFLQEQSQP